MSKFWFEHPTLLLTAYTGWKAKLSCPSGTSSYAHCSPQNPHGVCGIGHQELMVTMFMHRLRTRKATTTIQIRHSYRISLISSLIHLSSHKVWTKSVHKCLECMATWNLMQSVKQQLLPLIHQILFQSRLRMFKLNCFITTPNFILVS